MDYASLGRTGLTVSRLGLGCMSYGTPTWRPWVLDEAAARPFFRRAVEAGINFWDTADMYSAGVSEEVTGRALREFARRDEVVLATKVFFPLKPGPNMGGLSRKHILQACDASLSRLGVDTIDLYQIHRFDPSVPIEETLDALDHLVVAGKVRYIGARSGGGWRMARAVEPARARCPDAAAPGRREREERRHDPGGERRLFPQAVRPGERLGRGGRGRARRPGARRHDGRGRAGLAARPAGRGGADRRGDETRAPGSGAPGARLEAHARRAGRARGALPAAPGARLHGVSLTPSLPLELTPPPAAIPFFAANSTAPDS